MSFWGNGSTVQRWGKGEFFPKNGSVQYAGNLTSVAVGNLTTLMLGATSI